MPIILPILLFLAGLSLTQYQAADTARNETIKVFSQYAELAAWIEARRGQTLVINFWATSCPPCLKEMPHFGQLASEYSGKDVKVLLVSLDQVEDLDARVYPFIEKHRITPEVVLLGDMNYSAWTDEIDESWYGALPATIILDGDKRIFRFGAYETYEELERDLLSVEGRE